MQPLALEQRSAVYKAQSLGSSLIHTIPAPHQRSAVCRGHPLIQESSDAPAQKSTRRRGVTWCPGAHPISLQDFAGLLRQLFTPLRSGVQHRAPLTVVCHPHRLKSSRPWDRGLLWRTAHRSAGTQWPATAPAKSRMCGEKCKEAREEPASCLNLCDSVCSLKCIYLHKRALSSSLSQYSAARPASERYRATAHVGYSCPALASASNDQAAKAAMSVLEAWENYSRISRWLLGVIERGYAPQFRCRPPCFNGVVQSLTLPRNALVLRQELCNLLEKGAIERIPASELESSFYSRYFVVAKRDGGLRSILDLRPINRTLCKRPFRMISLEQILAQIRPGDWLRPWI